MLVPGIRGGREGNERHHGAHQQGKAPVEAWNRATSWPVHLGTTAQCQRERNTRFPITIAFPLAFTLYQDLRSITVDLVYSSSTSSLQGLVSPSHTTDANESIAIFTSTVVP